MENYELVQKTESSRLPKILISGSISWEDWLLKLKSEIENERTVIQVCMDGYSLIVTFQDPSCREFFLKKYKNQIISYYI